MLYIIVHVNKTGEGATEFIKDLPNLLKNSRTWEIETLNYTNATIRSTAKVTSLPSPPKYVLSESGNGAGSVVAEIDNAKGWTHDQCAEALKYLVYLCVTALRSRVTSIEISV